MALFKTIADKNGGHQVAMTADEEAAHIAAQAADAALQPRRDILSQIITLEAQQTPRRMREALSDPTFINSLNEQIATLRSKL